MGLERFDGFAQFDHFLVEPALVPHRGVDPLFEVLTHDFDFNLIEDAAARIQIAVEQIFFDDLFHAAALFGAPIERERSGH
jgi:hypothetical protein